MFSITRDLSDIYFGHANSKYHPDFFDETLKRAVKLIDIEPESVSMLNEKRYTVEGMIYSLFHEFQIVGKDENGNAVYGERDDRKPISFAKKIFQNINNLELSSNDPFSWHQYFGLLALMEIDSCILQNDIIFENIGAPPEHIPNWDEQVISSRIATLLSSREAVCFGEVLEAKNLPTSGLIKDKISKQARQAVLKRHQPLNHIKNLFVKFYFDSEDKTNKSKLARKFYNNLPIEQQKILTSTLRVENACRTLITHLNKTINSKPYTPYS